MTFIPTKTITYAHIKDIPLEADFFKATGPPKDQTILYYHGGGLVYGTRKDLPKPYLHLFLEAGYHVLTVDYPLTPESSLEDLLYYAKASLHWFLEKAVDSLSLKNTDYILFGRSAGAYIASYLTKEMKDTLPTSLILLYGYYNLADPKLTKPSIFYNKLMKVGFQQFNGLIQARPIPNGTLQKRFSLYLYLRQTGTWPFLRQDLQEEYSLTKEDFKTFPKTFIAYSNQDQDVPPEQSKQMAAMILDSTVFAVDEKDHDFDRDASSVVSIQLYEEILSWLK